MLNAGSIVVKILGDNKDLKKAVGEAKADIQSTGKKMQQVGGKMMKTGGILTAGLTLPILGIGKASLQAASDAEETQAKFNTVFGDLSEDVNAWANNYSEKVNRANVDLKKWLAGLQDTFVPLDFSRKKSAEFSKEMTKLAIDIASFNNQPTEKVLNNVKSALVGNHEAVKSYGVMITQARLKQKAFQMGLGDLRKEEGKVKGTMTEKEKVLARLQLLREDTTDAQGDAIRTSDSYANQIRGLKADMTELAAEIGEQLIPLAKDLIEKIKPAIEWFKGLSDEQKKMVVIIMAVVAAIGPLILGIGALISAIGTIVAAVSASMLVWGLIIAAIVALAYVIYTNWDTIKAFTLRVWNAIKNFFIGVWDSISKAFKTTIDWIKKYIMPAFKRIQKMMTLPIRIAYAIVYAILYGLYKFFAWIWSMIGDDVKAANEWIRNFIIETFRKVYRFVKRINNKIKNFVIGVWNWIKKRIKPPLTTIWNFLKRINNKIKDKVVGVWDKVKGAIVGAFKGAKEAIRPYVNGIIDAVNKVIEGYNSLPYTPDFSTISKMHTGGMIPESGIYALQEGEKVISKANTAAGEGEASPKITVNLKTNYVDSDILDKMSEDIAQTLDDKMRARGENQVFNLKGI